MATLNPPLRLAMIGCGRVVEHCHLPALRSLPAIEIVALVDSDPRRLHTLGDRLGVRRRSGDYHTILDDPGVDAVAVCTPPQTHAEIGLAMLDAGKHVVMEKPLALSFDDADRLVERAALSPRKALVGFNLRWHRLIRHARAIIDDGVLGPIETLHTAFTSRGEFPTHAAEWRRHHHLGGGVLFDLGIHHFDLWRFLTRSEVEEIFVRRGAGDPAVECTTVSATMSNGALVSATFSHGVSDTNEVDFCGRTRRLRLSCYSADSLRLVENSEPSGLLRNWLTGMRQAVESVAPVAWQVRRGGDVLASYRAEWQHFVTAVRDDAPVECSFEDGRTALQVALAATESAAHGRSVRVAHAARAITPIAAPAAAQRTVA